MNPKEKAEELVDKIYESTGIVNREDSIFIAHIAVDEILSNSVAMIDNSPSAEPSPNIFCDEEYWQEVKNHLNQM